jgi:Flp pilus assembly protein TadB
MAVTAAAAVVATVVAAAVVLAAVTAAVAAVVVVAAVGVRVRRKGAVIAEIPELPKTLDCDLGRWRYD